MPAQAYVFDIGGGVAYACQDCKDMSERTRTCLELQGCTLPDYYGPTTVDGDATCEGCGRDLRKLSCGA